MNPVDEARSFLLAVWGEHPPQGRLAISWDGGRGFCTRTFETVEAAAAFGVRAAGNVYVRVCSLRSEFTGPGRGTAQMSYGLPGFCVDCDTKPGAFSGPEAAWRFLDELPLAASAVVASGGGLHAWWLLDEPLLLDTPERWREGATLAERWRGFCRYQAVKAGSDLDAVGDLSQVLRLPGTRNYKYSPPRPVTVAREAGVRYPLAAITSLVGEAVQRTETKSPSVGAPPAVAINVDPPTLSDLHWLRQLMDLDPPLRALYGGQYDRKRYKSPSHADAALASKLLYYGCDPAMAQRLMRDSGPEQGQVRRQTPRW